MVLKVFLLIAVISLAQALPQLGINVGAHADPLGGVEGGLAGVELSEKVVGGYGGAGVYAETGGYAGAGGHVGAGGYVNEGHGGHGGHIHEDVLYHAPPGYNYQGHGYSEHGGHGHHPIKRSLPYDEYAPYLPYDGHVYDYHKGHDYSHGHEYDHQQGYLHNLGWDGYHRIKRSPQYNGYGGDADLLSLGHGLITGKSGSRLSQSSLGQSHNAARGSDVFGNEEASSVAASKSSSTGSSKKTKIKSESTFGAGDSRFAGQGFESDQNKHYGLNSQKSVAVGGGFLPGIALSTDLGINAGESSHIAGSQIAGQNSFSGGHSNTEIEQSEDTQQSNNQSIEAQHNRNVYGGSNYENVNSNLQKQKTDAASESAIEFSK